jgi:hypothetical protein
MGIALPEEARGDLAIAGDWKTVTTEVVGEVNEDGEFKEMSLNKGVHKRKLDEEEEEQKAAGEIITKRKGWGHTYKSFPGSKGGVDDLEVLLTRKKGATLEARDEAGIKKEEPREDEEDTALQSIPTVEEAQAIDTAVKSEEDAPVVPAVTFKKRKKIAK